MDSAFADGAVEMDALSRGRGPGWSLLGLSLTDRSALTRGSVICFEVLERVKVTVSGSILVEPPLGSQSLSEPGLAASERLVCPSGAALTAYGRGRAE
jgi:hypothetical protein